MDVWLIRTRVRARVLIVNLAELGLRDLELGQLVAGPPAKSSRIAILCSGILSRLGCVVSV